jgi:branched-chain amino acid transport system permease protein
MGEILVSFLDALSLGMVLFLAAAGLSLVMGVMQVINLAHGALFMIGGYIAWSITVDHGGSFWIGLLVAGVAVALLGVVLERLLLSRMPGELDSQVLATLGVLYIVTNLTIWIWGAGAKPPFFPPGLDGSVGIGGESYSVARLGLIGLGAVLVAALWWFQDGTRYGAMMRAGMDDRETASQLGINVGAVSAIVFAVGAAAAGVSGVLGQQLTGLSPDDGTSIVLLALVVLIVGGVGTVQGALLGAMLIAFIQSFGQTLFPDFAAFLIYAAMIVVLFIRPSGLLGREAVSRR